MSVTHLEEHYLHSSYRKDCVRCFILVVLGGGGGKKKKRFIRNKDKRIIRKRKNALALCALTVFLTYTSTTDFQ